jgi:formamidopyrimidine-DNA glycosylase
MPELPEVETIVRDLRPLLIGARFAAVRKGPRQLRKRWSRAWEPHLIDSEIVAIRRRGKWILVDLQPKRLLVMHLGMTGQLSVVARGSALEKHTHLIFQLNDGHGEFRFRDIRRFGSAALYADENEWTASLGASLGPEPFDLEPRSWRESLKKSRRAIKAFLLDQSVVAGVGNIYADESLFEAKIHPERCADEISTSGAERLRKGIVDVLSRAIAGRGSTIRDYVGGSGLMGQYQTALAVYGRTGEACVRCDRPIACIRLAGRSTHYCPKCQK